MKLLIVTNMYPTPQKSYMGIYVKNQFEKLKVLMPEDQLSVFHMHRQITNKLGSITKYTKAFLRFIPFLFRRYNIIHVHFFYPMILLAYVYKIFHPSAVIAVTFHGTDLRKHIQSRLNVFLYGKIIQSADIVIAVGKELAEEVELKLKKKVTDILSAGVDEKIFYHLPESEKKYDFLFVGTFIKTKGIDILLKAIEMVKDTKLRYCFVGSGELLSEIKKLDQYNIQVYQNLNQQEIARLYNESKFLLLPSRNEAFGLVVTEAMFCGLPAIVSGAGGLKDQVIDGFNGFITVENTPHQWAEVIKQAMIMDHERYFQLHKNALSSNKRHALTNICERLKDIYVQFYYGN